MGAVFTLLVQVGRKPGDGLPDKATGAALLIYASGVDEAEAVRDVLRTVVADYVKGTNASGQ